MGTFDEPFMGRVQQDEIRVRLRDGQMIVGSYLTIAGMHFVHVRDGSPQGSVAGPFDAAVVIAVELLRTRDEVVADRRERARGERHIGREPITALDFRWRLESLAEAVAREPESKRKWELETQFDELADAIVLARSKRRWMLGEAKWKRHSNEPPTRVDLSGGDLSTANRFEPPRDWDFDPDPRRRRARRPIPPHVANDPKSIRNVLKALSAAGFNARRSVTSAVGDDSADVLIDFPGGKADGRFTATASRLANGDMEWTRPAWEGDTRAPGLRAAPGPSPRRISGR